MRFISEDPIGFAGHDVNLHAYSLNSPTNLRDPNGTDPVDACWIGGLGNAAIRSGINLFSGRKTSFSDVGEYALSGCETGILMELSGANWLLGKVIGVTFDFAASQAADIFSSEVADAAFGVASAGGDAASSMTVVQIVETAELTEANANMLKELTFTTGNEHALVTLANGDAAIVSGGPGGINFAEGEITGMTAHTHPYTDVNFGPSKLDIQSIEKLGQPQSIILQRGTVCVFGACGIISFE
jgi:hypothetical protein